MDVFNLAMDAGEWLVLAVAGSIVSFFVALVLQRLSRSGGANPRVRRDGDFEVEIACDPYDAAGNQASRWFRVQLEVTNRGRRSTRAHRSAVLFVGRQEFPAERFVGSAFEEPIFPDSRARGVIAFRIPGHVVPTSIELDVDGDRRSIAFDLGQAKSPP